MKQSKIKVNIPIGNSRLRSLPFAPLDLGKTVSVTEVIAPLQPSVAIFSKLQCKRGRKRRPKEGAVAKQDGVLSVAEVTKDFTW